MMEAIAQEIEQFFTDVVQELGEIVEAVVEVSDDWSEQLQTAIAEEADQYLADFFDPILEAYLGVDLEIEDTSQSFPQSLEPGLNQHPACVGCRHYHGQVYSGNLLVCGMHPYGWENEHCPDWELL